MKVRINAGTDVAMLGAWDARMNAVPFTPEKLSEHLEMLEFEATKGNLFLIHTGADGGGPIDIYIDEDIPVAFLTQIKPVAQDFLLQVPSGALCLGGMEDYRSGKKNTGLSEITEIPSGDYAVQCFVPDSAENGHGSEDDLEKYVSRADIRYYDRRNSGGCLGGALTLLLFPTLTFPFGWKLSLVIAILASFSFFHIWEWVLKRNAKYQSLGRIILPHRHQHQSPTFIFQFRRIEDSSGLKTGSITL